MFSRIRERWSPEDLLVASLARVAPDVSIPEGPRRWTKIVRIARRERTANILYRHLTERPSNRDVPPALIVELEAIYLSVLGRNLILHKRLCGILAAMEGHAIPAMPLKGALLSLHLYDDVGLRDMADVDLLVRRGDVARAHDILTSQGYAPIEEGEGGGDYRNSRLYHRPSDDGRDLIHLHWHLANASIPLSTYRNAIDMDEIFGEARPIRYGNTTALCPTPHHLICHLAEHAMKHSFATLILVADAARLLDAFRLGESNDYTRLWGRVDEDRIASTAARWNLRRPMYAMTNLMKHAMGMDGLDDLIRAVRPTGHNFWDRLFQNALARNRRRDGLSIPGYLSMAGGLAAQVRLVAGMLFPSSSTMEDLGKHPTPAAYLRRIRNGLRMIVNAVQTS